MAQEKTRKDAAPRRSTKTTTEPSVRIFTKWTPGLLKSAEIAADGGDLTQAARVCDWLLSDDTIRGCLSARVGSLLGLTPQFEKSGDRRRSGVAVRALEAGEDYWESYPDAEIWLMHSWGLLLGIAPMRHNPRYVDGHQGRLLPCPEFWHPAAGLRQDQTTGEWKIRVAVDGNRNAFGTEEIITPGDGTWLLHTPFGKHRPASMGFWRCLSWWKLLKDYGRGDYARHMEKGSLLVLTQSKDVQNAPGQFTTDKQTREASATELYQRGKDAVAALQTGQDLKLVQADGEAYKLYTEAAKAANLAFSVCIRGGNLTTNTQGGSLAAAEVQERTGDLVNLRFDAETVATTLHDQSLTSWAEWNFGARSLAPWPSYPVAPPRNMKAFAETISAFDKACADLELAGFVVDRQKMLEEFELQEFVMPGKRPPVVVVTSKPEPANDTKPEHDPAHPPIQEP